MKKFFRNTSLLLFPFALMVIINEWGRNYSTAENSLRLGLQTINTAKALKNNCTWTCHDNTEFCKEQHVKLLKNTFQFTDPLYFGTIRLLKSGGNYAVANIILLVILMPFGIWFFLIKSLDMQKMIKKLQSEKRS